MSKKLAPVEPDTRSRAALEGAFRAASAFVSSLDRTSVAPTATAAGLRANLGGELADHGVAADTVISDMIRAVEGGIAGSASGRYFAWVIGGSLPSALAADWLVSAWDQNAALYATAPAAAVVEEVAGVWLKQVLGLPSSASFAFTTGCQMAHVTCLAAARHSVLSKAGWEVEKRGLFGAPFIRVVSSSQRHGAIDRALRLLGLGRENLQFLEPDEQGGLPCGSLEQTLMDDSAMPTIVLLQAGDINTGAFDRFSQLIPLSHRHGAWVHVDGAFGLFAAASPRLRYLVDGVAAADSWAADGHKWLNVPYDCGYAFVVDSAAHRATMSYQAPYIDDSPQARDQIDWNPEWSRRARGFPTYAALRELGRDGIAALVERSCDHARALVERIGELPGSEIMWTPHINQGLVRFLSLEPGAADFDHDTTTDEVISRINATGEAFFSGTTWRGRRAMRVSVCNWRTTAHDVERAVRAVANALRAG